MSAIATYPTGADYVEALQDTWRCFRDPELIGCSVRTDNFGIPRPISGNFASVFMAETAGGRKLAIKCFTRDVPDQQTRYRKIAAALRDVPAAWKVEFRYVDAGVVVRGRLYPVLVMEWIAAKQLIPSIEDRLGDRAALAGLADGFAELVASLETAGIAHGDLQHGNLLVTARGELRLIDYDGMYVPALRDRPALELGQPNYQHPRRAAGDYGPWLDRFSARVIHLSLAALATDPGLWPRLHKPGGEYLLLQKYDLEDLGASDNLASLGAVSSAVRARATELAELARRPLAAIPPLERTAPLSRTPPQRLASAESRSPAASAGSLASATALAAGPPPALGSWIDDHLPAPAPVALDRPAWPARIAWYFSLIVIATLIAAIALVPPGGPVAVVAVLAAVGSGFVLLLWRVVFASLPQAQDRKVRRTVHAAARAQHRQVEAQLKWQLAAREMSIESYQQDLRALTHRRTQIDRDSAAEHARIDRWRDQELAKLVRERTNLKAWKDAETVNRITGVESRHVNEQLARHRIDRAQISNIGPGVAAELEAVGIRTAADFRGIRMQGGFGRTTTAVILHRDGRALRVAMVGEVRAKSLGVWRDGLAARARGKMPPQLTAAIRAQLDVEAAAKAAGITAREASVKAAADVQRRTALDQTQTQRETLTADERSTRSSHAAAIAVIDRDCARHSDEAEASQRQLRTERRALDAYCAVRFRRYLRALTTGRP
jgi:hypothetical protein